MQVCEAVLINGVETRGVDCADRGLQYGDGHFTTLRVSRGKPLLLAAHLDRLEADAARLLIPFPERSTLASEALCLAASLGEGVLKIVLTRGRGGRGYRLPIPATGTRILSVHPLPDYPPQLARDGIRVRFCSARLGINPLLAGIKHLNRLEQILARAEWDDEAVREGLMLDAEGFVVEGVMSNLFFVQGNRLLTPLLDRCGVRGVMRGQVMAFAPEQGLSVEEGRFTTADVLAADELFLTNSVIGVWPIRQLDASRFPVGPVTRWMSRRMGDSLCPD